MIIGIPGLSNAISISSNLGLSEDLVNEAKELLITHRDPSALAVERLQDTQQKLDVNSLNSEIMDLIRRKSIHLQALIQTNQSSIPQIL